MTQQSSNGPEQTVALESIVDHAAVGLRVMLVVLMVAVILIADGYDLVISGYAAPFVSSEFGLSKVAMGWVLTIANIGVAVGGVIGGYCGDRIGRVKSIAIVVFVFSIGSLLCSYATNIQTFLIARVITSLGLGAASPTLAAYLAEILPVRWRASTSLAAFTAMSLGGIICGGLGRIFLVNGDWRIMFQFGAVLLVAVPVILIALPESPKYLLVKGAPPAAIRKSLRRLFSLELDPDVKFTSPAQQSKADRLSWRHVLAPGERKTFLMAVGFVLATYFSTVAVGSMSAFVLHSMALGPAAVADTLIAVSTAGLAGALAATLLIRRVGSKILMLAFLALACCGFGATALLAAGEGAALAQYSFPLASFGIMATFTMMFPVTAQAFTTAIRSTATGLVTSAGRLGSMTGPIFMASLLQIYGPSALLAVVCSVIVLAMAAVALFDRHVPGSATAK